MALKLISSSSNKSWLVDLAKYICTIIEQRKIWFAGDELSNVVSHLFKKAPDETWNVFEQAIEAADTSGRYNLITFLGRSGNRFDHSTSPLWLLPEKTFRNWIERNQNLVPILLNEISLYTVETDADDSQTFHWHPYAFILLSEGTDEESLKRELMRNLYSFGSIGSRVPYLQKRRELLKELEASGEHKLMRVAKPLIQWIDEEIERTRREELNEEVTHGF